MVVTHEPVQSVCKFAQSSLCTLEISVSPDCVHLRMLLPTFTILLFLAVLTLVVGSSRSGFFVYFRKESGPYFSSTGQLRGVFHITSLLLCW